VTPATDAERVVKRLFQEDDKCLRGKNATKYLQKLPDVFAHKYLRKFAFDKMIELGVPENIADFIEGGCPRLSRGIIVLNQEDQRLNYALSMVKNAGVEYYKPNFSVSDKPS
jgi:hypothetical protein